MHKILIVEDEDIIRNALKKLLEKHGYHVTDTASVPEAKQQDFSRYQLVISDLRLPGGQGTDLIPLAGNTPVLIMTSYASMRSAVEAMKQGAVDYIAKPFDHKEMIATVRTLLGEEVVQEQKQQTASETKNTPEPDKTKPSGEKQTRESLDEYFVRFVRENEKQMNETELAKQLGISRKSLWERRNKLGIPRKK
jgi:DNA-binding NtrC family response regulator